jgi:UDP-GlcNAc:undecaprenyl-phosphate GlcNAc-1-phosphate transferase
VSLYVLAIGLTSTTISADVSWLAGGIAALLLVAALRFEPHPSIERLAHGAVFVAMVMVVYLDHIEPARLPLFKALKLVILPLLAAAVVVRIRFARERRFAVTTLDVLVVFMALVLPNLPGLSRAPSNLGLSIGKLIILLYAVEMLAGHSERVRAWLWGSTAAGLAVLAVRGLWPGAG